MPDSSSKLYELLTASVQECQLRKAVFSKPRSGSNAHLRVDVRPVRLRSEAVIQFTTRTRTQEFHQNLSPELAVQELLRLAREEYRDIRIEVPSAVWEARFSKKNDCFLTKRELKNAKTQQPDLHQPHRKLPSNPAVSASPTDTDRDSGWQFPIADHDRPRSYLIPDGVPCPFLIHLGVMTSEGQVRAKYYHKFRQINRYVEFIHDVVRKLPEDQTIQVVDFGCGKSYLTFATHYLLTKVCGRDCYVVGLDRRSDVVESCRSAADAIGLKNIEFHIAEISSFEPVGPVHLAISLHACDTATDDAILQAIRWNSDVILAVPCCQHELANLLKKTAMPVMLEHGILKDRFAALATDGMRAAALSSLGYETQVVEFIDMEHTAKNLLIRAFRTPTADKLLRRRENTQSGANYDDLTENGPSLEYERLLEFRRQLNVGPLTLERNLLQHGMLKPGRVAEDNPSTL